MRRVLLGIFILASTVGGVRAADSLVAGDFSAGVDQRGVPQGWQLRERSGHAELGVVDDDGHHALHLRSTNSSFSVQRELRADLGKYPILSWKWKVTALPAGGDFRHARTDDQAAQLFVAFSRTQTIVYLWDTTAPQGYMGEALAPPFMSIKVVVVRSSRADTGKWLTETRNVYEDYKRFFGRTATPPMVSGMRLQINTQHTKTSGESFFADISFRKAPATASAPLKSGANLAARSSVTGASRS